MHTRKAHALFLEAKRGERCNAFKELYLLAGPDNKNSAQFSETTSFSSTNPEVFHYLSLCYLKGYMCEKNEKISLFFAEKAISLLDINKNKHPALAEIATFATEKRRLKKAELDDATCRPLKSNNQEIENRKKTEDIEIIESKFLDTLISFADQAGDEFKKLLKLLQETADKGYAFELFEFIQTSARPANPLFRHFANHQKLTTLCYLLQQNDPDKLKKLNKLINDHIPSLPLKEYKNQMPSMFT